MKIVILSLLVAAATSLPTRAALTAYWNFDENTGTSAANSANVAYAGTVAGGASWIPGPVGFGSALGFDGVDDQVTTSYSAVTGGSVRTVAAWIRYPDQAVGGAELDAILSYGQNTTSQRWTMRISDTAAVVPNRLRLEVAGGGAYGSTDLNDGLWHHVAVVQSGSTLGTVQLYVDGALETMSYNGGGSALAINTTVTSNNVYIGGSQHAANYSFLGSIDEVRIYDSALTQSEVQALMVPEPGAGSIMLLAGIGMVLRRRRQ